MTEQETEEQIIKRVGRDILVTSCFKCNRAKRDKTLEEWLGKNTLDKA